MISRLVASMSSALEKIVSAVSFVTVAIIFSYRFRAVKDQLASETEDGSIFRRNMKFLLLRTKPPASRINYLAGCPQQTDAYKCDQPRFRRP